MNIVVVGASGGIGAALVDALRHDGHRLYTLSRKGQHTDAACDITNRGAIQDAFTRLITEGFAPDCVIIASGVFEHDLLPQYDRALLNKNFAVNFFGAMNVIDAVLPYFLSVKKGHIIALSSIAAFRPNVRGVGYSSSKAALSLAMRGFDMAFRPHGIAFSVANVGPTQTAMWEGGDSFLVARPEKIARAIATLVGTRKPVLYTPFLSTSLARAARILPDRFYIWLRKILLG